MPYRATERTRAKQAATRDNLLLAARQLLAEGGYAAVHVAEVARRAGVATGTVYRYFPSKGELFAEVFRSICDHEVAVMRAGAATEGTYRERLVSVLRLFAIRAMQSQRIAHALIAEPVEPQVDVERLRFRAEYTAILSELLRGAHAAGECVVRNPEILAAFLVGGVAQSLITTPIGMGTKTAEFAPEIMIESITYAVENAVFGGLDATL